LNCIYRCVSTTDLIAEFLQVKDIRKATMIGAVMGGALAVQVMLDHPEMSGGWSAPHQTAARASTKVVGSPGIGPASLG